MRRLAEWFYDHRVYTGVAILLVTFFLGWQVRNLDVSTHFRDLYPQNHPHIKLSEEYPAFGSPLTVSLVVQVKQGTIYNPQTLSKIQQATALIDAIPGVNHDQILSIASRKVKNVEATIGGIRSTNLLLGPVPKTSAGIAGLRDKIRSMPGLVGTLVSVREDAAMVRATFIERLADYNTIFNGVNKIIKELQDKDHDVYAAGLPMLTGWVYFYEQQMLLIFAVTLLGMILLLALHMRNLAGVVTPIVVSTATALWGLGFAGLFGVSIDPLIMVLPMLLVARSFSHAVQACERYFEIYADTGDKREACVRSLVSIFPPGTLGIITDAAGLFFIAVAPIPVMHKVAFLCGFWALSLIPANVLFTPIVLSYLPAPRNAAKVVGRQPTERNEGWLSGAFDRGIDHALALTGRLSQGKAAWGTVCALALVLAWAGTTTIHLTVGDVQAGTPLLWPTSPYNTAVKRINERFAGFDVLQVVFEGNKQYAIETPAGLNLIQRFQNHMERDPEVGGTFSFADLVPMVNSIFHGGTPKWGVVPDKEADAALLSQMAMTGASPGDFDHQLSSDIRVANVSVWYKDHRGKTIKRALSRAQEFIDSEESKADGFKVRLATGSIGLLGAINETVARSELQILLLVLGAVFVTCSITYRSIVAALLLLIPVNVSNLIAAAVMVKMGIGLDVNTLPVAAVGIGVGIDYGIYLMSRICEEYQLEGSFEKAITKAVGTTGRAILFTATTLLVGIAPWYVLSDLRFQADMGLLIAFLMLINMAVAMVVVPLLLYIVQPRFVGRVRYIVAGKAG